MTQTTTIETLSKGAVAGKVAFGGIAAEVVEQAAQVGFAAAQVGFAAVRELGVSAGNVDLPTWQIAPGAIKRDYRTAAREAMELMEEEPGAVYRVWCQRRFVEFGQEVRQQVNGLSWTKTWTELTEAQRFQFGLFVGVVRAFEGVNKRIR